jgi:hypothetical protein
VDGRLRETEQQVACFTHEVSESGVPVRKKEWHLQLVARSQHRHTPYAGDRHAWGGLLTAQAFHAVAEGLAGNCSDDLEQWPSRYGINLAGKRLNYEGGLGFVVGRRQQ